MQYGITKIHHLQYTDIVIYCIIVLYIISAGNIVLTLFFQFAEVLSIVSDLTT